MVRPSNVSTEGLSFADAKANLDAFLRRENMGPSGSVGKVVSTPRKVLPPQPPPRYPTGTSEIRSDNGSVPTALSDWADLVRIEEVAILPEPKVIGKPEWAAMMVLISVRHPECSALCLAMCQPDDIDVVVNDNRLLIATVREELCKLGAPFSVQLFETSPEKLWSRVGHNVIVRSGESRCVDVELPVEYFYTKVRRSPVEGISLLSDKYHASSSAIEPFEAIKAGMGIRYTLGQRPATGWRKLFRHNSV